MEASGLKTILLDIDFSVVVVSSPCAFLSDVVAVVVAVVVVVAVEVVDTVVVLLAVVVAVKVVIVAGEVVE